MLSTFRERVLAYNNPPPLDWTSNRLKGRTVLVTGASSGIGRAAADLFAREGANVIAASRRTDQITELAAQLSAEGFSVKAVTCDVADEAAVASTVAFCVESFGRLDGAFNNAGQGSVRGPVHPLELRDYERVMATNLRGVFLCLKHEAAAMLSSGGGSIVNTSSIGGLVGAAGNSIYAASKWGLAGLTRCAALDYARENIRVNAIAPGPTRSEMFDRWMTDEPAREAMADVFPMNYIAHPADMARVALWLLSDESRWTTGAIIPCGGGASAD